MANELSNIGYKIIFDVSSPTPGTHAFYKQLILKSNIKSLIFNCQTLKLNRYRVLSIERFKIFNDLPKDISFIINGFAVKKYLKDIFRALKGREVYMTSSSPFIRAICKQQLTKARYADEEPKNLFIKYMNESKKLIEEAKQCA